VSGRLVAGCDWGVFSRGVLGDSSLGSVSLTRSESWGGSVVDCGQSFWDNQGGFSSMVIPGVVPGVDPRHSSHGVQ
jgi:hypothetical protein